MGLIQYLLLLNCLNYHHIQLGQHEHDYLGICKHYRSVQDTDSVREVNHENDIVMKKTMKKPWWKWEMGSLKTLSLHPGHAHPVEQDSQHRAVRGACQA